jgi:ectoine hydroxylase-related dioxygenase (phytanoyl-CoA dioxygenase family)
MARLTGGEIARYHEQGWLVPPWRLPDAQLHTMQQALAALIRNNPGVRPEKLVNAHIDRDNAEGVRGHPAFFALAREPEILDMVAQLIGEDIVLWGCQVFSKPGTDGYETPWHQDGHYWPIRPLATCTAWVALEPSTRDNGCLRAIPGSHRDRVLHPHLHEDRADLVLNQRTADHAFDPSQAVDIELEPGQLSLHDAHLIHGARANRSGVRRTGVALRYMPASSVFRRDLQTADGRSGLPVDFARRPLWLLRGRDRSGRNDFGIGHPDGERGD